MALHDQTPTVSRPSVAISAAPLDPRQRARVIAFIDALVLAAQVALDPDGVRDIALDAEESRNAQRILNAAATAFGIELNPRDLACGSLAKLAQEIRFKLGAS